MAAMEKGSLLKLSASVLLALTVSQAAAGGVTDEVDVLISNGDAAQAKGDAATALQDYMLAQRLAPSASNLRRIARAYAAMGRFADAFRYFREALAGELPAADKTAAEAELAEVRSKVAVLDLSASAPGAKVTWLNMSATLPTQIAVMPGDSVLQVSLQGYRDASLPLSALQAGETRTLQVPLVRMEGRVVFQGPPGTNVVIDQEDGPIACVVPCSQLLATGAHTVYFKGKKGSLPTQDFNLEDGAALTIDASAAPVVEIDASLLGFSDETVAGVKADIAKSQARQAELRAKLDASGLGAADTDNFTRELAAEVAREAELRELINLPASTVTVASREAESIDDAPASVTLITRQELEAFAYPTILESLRGVRGYAVHYDSIFANGSVRGLGQANDYSNRLLLLSDGATLNENSLFQGYLHYDGRTDLGDIDHIEVVRGPSSVLYGSGAMTGVVNLVLRDKQAPDGVHVQVSGYDNTTTRARAGFVKHFNADAGMWASVSAARSDGHDIDFADTRISHVDQFRGFNTTGKVWWKDVSAQWFYNARRVSIPTGNYATILNNPDTFSRDGRSMAEIKYDGQLNKSTRLMVRAHVDSFLYAADYLYDDVDGFNQPVVGVSRELDTGKWGGVEARLHLKLQPNLRVVVGAEGVFNIEAALLGAYAADAETFETSHDISAPYQTAASSALLDWSPSKKLRVQGGLRFDYINYEGDRNHAADQTAGASSYTALSPRLAIIARPDAQNTIKLMTGKGFRAPTIYEQFYSDAGNTSLRSDFDGGFLQSEDLYAGEVEATHRFKGDWSVLGAVHGALAKRIIETVQVSADYVAEHPEVPEDAVYYRNSPINQSVIGADLELRRQFRNGYMFSAHYSALLARYTREPSDDPALNSRELPNAPTHSAALKLIVPIVPDAMNGAIRAAFEDRRRIDPSTLEKSDRAVVADLVLSGYLKGLRVRYAVGAYNIFNWHYREPAVGFAANAIPQQARTFMFSLTAER
jgi:outer membrane receptor protein involved in Fe transport